MGDSESKRIPSAARTGLLGAVLLAAACGGSGEPRIESGNQAVLTGSTFEGSDGNLGVDTAGDEDWSPNAPALVIQPDLPSGSGDDSFGQGTKEDDPNTSVVSGSIPPQKSDLTRFYLAHENVGGNFFLYLAWERVNDLGNANMDFEFNQATQTLTGGSSGTVVLIRTAGDILVTYDFSGSGTPTLGLLRWATDATTPTPPSGQAANLCFSANKFPCWANRVDLTAAGFAEGAVNSATVTDPIAGVSLGQNRFGEAAINLTAANVFPSGQCVNFASVFLKSRSSSSFTSEVKDFVPPATANISNCGTINIHKQDSSGNPIAGVKFKLYVGAASSPPATTCPGAAVSPAVTCTTDASGNCSMTNVTFGTYCLAEDGSLPNFFTPNAQTVVVAQGGSTPDPVTFVNVPKPGAIKVTKTDGKGHPLQGATFHVLLNGSQVGGVMQTGADGVACFSGLTVGTTYQVQETIAPTGYSFDGTPKDVTVNNPSTDCTAAQNPAVVGFDDTPLSEFTVTFKSLAPPIGMPPTPVTSATIQCTGDSGATSLLNPYTRTNLAPGTYTCTIVIDP
jgi:hypothetical protein